MKGRVGGFGGRTASPVSENPAEVCSQMVEKQTIIILQLCRRKLLRLNPLERFFLGQLTSESSSLLWSTSESLNSLPTRCCLCK